MESTCWAVIDRFGNSSVGRDMIVSVHRSEALAVAALDRVNRSVRRGCGQHTHSGWTVEEVVAELHGRATRKGDSASHSSGRLA